MIEQTKKEPTEFTDGQTNNKHVAQMANKEVCATSQADI